MIYNADLIATVARYQVEENRRMIRVTKKEFMQEIGEGVEPDYIDKDTEISVRPAPGYWDPHSRLVKTTDKLFIDDCSNILLGAILRVNNRNVYILNVRWE